MEIEIIKNKISSEYLNYIQKEIYENAVSHGWHDKTYSTSHYRAMIITEMAEAIEADRNGGWADITKFNHLMETTHSVKIAFNKAIKHTVQEEMSDVIIRTLDFYEDCGITPKIKFTAELQNLDVFRNMDLTEFIDFLISHMFYEKRYLDKTLTYIVQWAESKDINIWDFVFLKMAYNKTREFKHGGKKY